MRFYLGTHRPGWLATLGVPMMVSHRRLSRYKTLPVASTGWVLDSGGFSELRLFGGWQTTPQEYVADVRRYRDEIGSLEWAAPQDWMCEPFMLERTGLSVTEHQLRTVDNFLQLRFLAPDLPFIPVLQGWTLDDYLRCIEMYPIDLADEPTVGIGSVCRRQNTGEIELILGTLAGMGLRLHGFGVKASGLDRYAEHIQSSDSLAWSYRARHAPALAGCTHRNCANCSRYALLWRERMVFHSNHVQTHLPMEVSA